MTRSLVAYFLPATGDDDASKEGPGANKRQLPVAGHNAVDKYFGTRLPPVCERLGCYKSDDGERFYCVNHACQKHRRRRTKHSSPRRPTPRGTKALFRCPSCRGQNVDVLRAGEYQCRRCLHQWTV